MSTGKSIDKASTGARATARRAGGDFADIATGEARANTPSAEVSSEAECLCEGEFPAHCGPECSCWHHDEMRPEYSTSPMKHQPGDELRRAFAQGWNEELRRQYPDGPVRETRHEVSERTDVEVSTSPELYARAVDRAKSKAQHSQKPGDLELPEKTGYWYSNSYAEPGQLVDRDGNCVGQLRTAYVRLSVGGDTWTPGKPTWTPVGIVCGACRAFWPGTEKLPTSNGR